MRGICFKEPLFHKVVDGTKTQTRRMIFPKTDYTFWSQPSFLGMHKDPDSAFKTDREGEMICYKDGEPKMFKFKGTFGLFEGDQFYFDNSYVRPKYQPGEIIYLKEPYNLIKKYPNATGENSKVYVPHYAFDKKAHIKIMKLWKNKLFMPEKYARHFIQITDVTAQRVDEITEADAIAEGFPGISRFQSTWISIHGFSSWHDNPWVWKYTFERQAVTEGLISFILNSKQNA
jgi:hypothetical protein